MSYFDAPVQEVRSLEEFRERVRALGFEQCEAELERVVKPAVRFSLEHGDRATFPERSTYFGGRPDVASDFAWPHHGTRPLAFIAQFDLAEISRTVSLRLPPNGLLSVFYNTADQPWGRGDDSGSCAIYWTPPDVRTVRTTSPADHEEWEFGPPADSWGRHELWPCRAVARVAMTLPSVEHRSLIPVLGDGILKWRTQSPIIERYEALRHTLGCYGDTQLGGHPGELQGSVERDADFGAFGERPDTPETFARAARWESLLCVGYEDETLGIMWALSGALYFLNPPGRSERFDFSRAWAIIQGT